MIFCFKALASNSCYVEDFKNFKTGTNPQKSWVCKNTTAKLHNGTVRLTETGEKSYGTIYKYVFCKKGFNYLQIKIGNVENMRYYAACSNASSGGSKFGKLFPGWNTFDFKAQNFYNKRDCSFALSIQKFGPIGETDLGWIDFEKIQIVRKPLNGITIDLKQSGNKKDQTARVGDKILFRYYAPEKIDQNLELKCYYIKSMTPFLLNGKKTIILNDSGKNGDLDAGDNIYSAEVTINSNTPSLKSDHKDRVLLATICNDYLQSNAIASFGFDIHTQKELNNSSIAFSTPMAHKYRALWKERTKGKNLALGKKIKYSITPNYKLTSRGNTDSIDLTDGKLSQSKDDRIWYCKGSVGWYEGAAKGINMMMDLGKNEEIDKIVVRLLAGKPSSPNLSSPYKLEAYVSKDGENFYKTASLQKLMPAESNQSDFEKFYYLPENGIAYVYPFQLKVNAEAKYIVLRLTGSSGWMFLDEIAVMKAENKNEKFNIAYSYTPQKMFFEGIAVKPSKGVLTISQNIMTPCFLDIQDSRQIINKRKKIKLQIEVPEGIKLISPESEKKRGGNKYVINSNLEYLSKKPLYFKVESIPNGNLYASITAGCEGEKDINIKVPVKIIKIPEVPQLKRIHVSLAWFLIKDAMKYPDFFHAWKTMGFNAVGTFPRYWNGQISEDKKAFLKKIRKNKMQIIMNSSPFWGLIRMKLPAGAEIYTQIDGKKCYIPNICPSYRGKYYKQEMERISHLVKILAPDYVFWDIECWAQGVRDSLSCQTCGRAMEQKGFKSMKQYLSECGTEHMRDLFDAVKAGSIKSKIPIVATYDNEPLQPIYQYGLYKWDQLYPEYIKLAMPSLYVAGNSEAVHNSIRKNFNLMKNRKIIPWLTAGCYGEFDSYKLEYMIYEALLNGAQGITYYRFNNFDTPDDYFYHAKALKTIAPFEDLIMDGKILEPTGSNKKLFYSGVKNNKEMLLLIGNYNRADGNTSIRLPIKQVNEITDIINNKKIRPSSLLKLYVPKGGIKFLHIKAK
jgi:hypothetical protein